MDKEVEELLNTALHAIRAFSSYGHGASLTAAGNITDSNLQRAQDAINKALIRVKEKPSEPDRNCDKDWFNETC